MLPNGRVGMGTSNLTSVWDSNILTIKNPSATGSTGL